MFDGFKTQRLPGDGVDIHLVIGGQGPPLLLLHGYPQTHVCWHKVAPLLADSFTIVAPDLRGYGDSGKPPTDPTHEPYSKRRMAADQVRVMEQLGFKRFLVAGTTAADASRTGSRSITRTRSKNSRSSISRRRSKCFAAPMSNSPAPISTGSS